MITLPYYFPVLSSEEQLSFFDRVLDAAEVPVFLYNMPQTIGAGIALSVVESLSRRGNVAGIKDSSGRLDYLGELLTLTGQGSFRVLVGDERLATEGLLRGASGIVPSLGNALPGLLVDLWEACRAGNRERGRALQNRVDRINRISEGSASWMATIACRKKMLELLGVCGGAMSQPALEVPPAMERELGKALDEERAFERE